MAPLLLQVPIPISPLVEAMAIFGGFQLELGIQIELNPKTFWRSSERYAISSLWRGKQRVTSRERRIMPFDSFEGFGALILLTFGFQVVPVAVVAGRVIDIIIVLVIAQP